MCRVTHAGKLAEGPFLSQRCKNAGLTNLRLGFYREPLERPLPDAQLFWTGTVSWCENYTQIERFDDFSRRRTETVENSVKHGSIDPRHFRPSGLASGFLDFLPQERNDVIHSQDKHARSLL